MSSYGNKSPTGRTVLEEALDRIRHAYSLCDTAVVHFSGGKDSTVLLNLVVQVATELGRLPVEVMFGDEEAIAPDTEDYVRRVAARPEIHLTWSCVPVKHRNACSRRQPWWYTWNPADEPLWVRPMPPEGVSHESAPHVPWAGLAEQAGHFYPAAEYGVVMEFLGRRTQESLNRFKMVAQRGGFESFMTKANRPDFPHMRRADPIYDFTTADVWTLILTEGWDYNNAYDLFTALGITAFGQRIAPPFGEEPSQLLWMWQRCWPETWDRMQARVPGADCAARYSKTGVYAFRDHSLIGPSEGETWEEYTFRLVMEYPPDDRAFLAQAMRRALLHHDRSTDGDPMPDEEDDPRSGVCWKTLAQIAFRGNLKQRTLTMKLYGRAKPAAERAARKEAQRAEREG